MDLRKKAQGSGARRLEDRLTLEAIGTSSRDGPDLATAARRLTPVLGVGKEAPNGPEREAPTGKVVGVRRPDVLKTPAFPLILPSMIKDATG